jgi:hypothetical protein
MKVYVVTSGCYSNYGIEEIFSTKEKAQEYINLVNEYDAYALNVEIEEFELDPVVKVKNPHKFKYFYYIHMNRNGDVLQISKSNFDIRKPEETQEWFKLYMERKFNEKEHKFDDYYILRADVNANSEEHAIKICGEKRSKLLAENKWPETANTIIDKRAIEV